MFTKKPFSEKITSLGEENVLLWHFLNSQSDFFEISIQFSNENF